MDLDFLDEKNEFLVIGLVGAVGSRLQSLSNILKSLLINNFNYQVEEIRISEEFLERISNKNHGTKFERYTDLMDVGNNLRKKYNNHYLALKAVELISNKRKESKNKRIVFIINSLKHDLEIKVLREIYGKNFYQISLYESPSIRMDVLINDIGMNPQQAKELMDRDESEANDYRQHTRDAFHLADYFIKFDNKTNEHIKNSCLRFLELIFGNPYITPTFNEFSMYMAYTSSLKSADLSRQVGAVLAKDRNIISTGANDIPRFGGGQYWPEYNEENGKIYDIENGRDYKVGHDSNQIEKQKIIDELFNSIVNEFPTIFNKDNNEHSRNMSKLNDLIGRSSLKDITEYGRVVHAEMDAILACGRTNNSTKDSSIFVTTFPCHNCAKHIVSAGIKEVFFIEPYPKSKALELWSDSMILKSAKNERVDNKLMFIPFVGVGPRSFLNLFSMSQGVYREVKRKVKGEGKIFKESDLKKELKLTTNVFSLNEIEEYIKRKIKDMENSGHY